MAKDYDPHMHTAEHVLNQTMIRLFGCGRCFSSHLNPGKSKCDYHFDRDLTDIEAAALENAVNAVLEQNLPVRERLVPRREAEKLVNLSKLPASVGPDDPIRLISIGDYDLCPCIGAHAASTGEIGRFCLISHGLLDRSAGETGEASGQSKTANASGSSVLRLRFKID